MNFPFEIHRMKPSTILDHSFRIYRANFLSLFVFSFLINGTVSLLFQLITIDAQMPGFNYFSQFLNNFSNPNSSLSPFGSDILTPGYSGLSVALFYLFMILTNLFVSSFVVGGIILTSSNYYHGTKRRPLENLKATLNIYGQLILLALCNLLFFIGLFFVLSIIVLLPVSLLLITLAATGNPFIGILPILGIVSFVGSLYLSIDYMSYCALACEGKIAYSATMRGLVLTCKRIGKSFWVCFLAFAMQIIIQLAVGALIGLITASVESSSVSFEVLIIITSVASVILTALVLPVICIVVMLLYFDSRIKLESYDLNLRVGVLLAKRKAVTADSSAINTSAFTGASPQTALPQSFFAGTIPHEDPPCESDSEE